MTRSRIASRAVWHSGLGPLLTLRRRQWRGVLVLTYHRILDEPGPRHLGAVWSATPRQFETQLDQLMDSCQVVDSSRVTELCETSGRQVAITFDDGYRDNYEHAFPRLRERGLPATLFLTTGVLDGVTVPWWDQIDWLCGGIPAARRGRFGSTEDVIARYRRSVRPEAQRLLSELATVSTRAPLTAADVRDEWMTWAMAREMHAGGVTIEAHTVHHPLLAQLRPEDQFEEIVTSADRIEAEIGRRPRAFAYPVGSRVAFDEASKDAVARAGMDHGFSLYGGLPASREEWDPFDVRRVGLNPQHDRVALGALLALPSVFGRVHGEPPPRAPALATAPPVVSLPTSGATAGCRPPRARLRVVTLVDRLSDGGAEKLAYQLMRDLDPDRFERTLCATAADDPAHAEPGSETGRWAEELQDAGVRMLNLHRSRRSELRGWGPLLRQLRRTDVLHAHMFDSNVWASSIGRSMGVPVIVTHEHAYAHTGGRWQPWIDRRIVARGSDALIVPAQMVRERMVHEDGVPGQRVVVVPNGVEGRPPTPGRDVRTELGIAPGALVVGCVAGLRPVKRVDVLIEAAVHLRHRHPGIQVVIVGGGSERERLEELIVQRCVTDVVRLLGPRSDVPDLLTAFDVAVTCSDAEASPLSIMEYMEAGLPTVATRVGGIPELIVDGQHGLLVPRGRPTALANAIERLLDDPQQRCRLGKAAQARRRQEFDLELMVERVAELYEQLYAERTR